jgi:hypothetical protein
MIHECDRREIDGIPMDHKRFFGQAVSIIERIDGVWVAHNDEYQSGIKYCPFCGMNLALLNWTEEEMEATNNVGTAIGIVSKDL